MTLGEGLLRIHDAVVRELVRSHLRRTHLELSAVDASGLVPALKAARRRHLAELERYCRRGAFPRNTDFPGRRVPYLRDRFGTTCAVAHLIESSGGGALVDALAAADNNVRVGDVRRGPLLSWIERSGLTRAEVARIQPGYPGGGGLGGILIEYVPPVEPTALTLALVAVTLFLALELAGCLLAERLSPDRRAPRQALVILSAFAAGTAVAVYAMTPLARELALLLYRPLPPFAASDHELAALLLAPLTAVLGWTALRRTLRAWAGSRLRPERAEPPPASWSLPDDALPPPSGAARVLTALGLARR